MARVSEMTPVFMSCVDGLCRWPVNTSNVYRASRYVQAVCLVNWTSALAPMVFGGLESTFYVPFCQQLWFFWLSSRRWDKYHCHGPRVFMLRCFVLTDYWWCKLQQFHRLVLIWSCALRNDRGTTSVRRLRRTRDVSAHLSGGTKVSKNYSARCSQLHKTGMTLVGLNNWTCKNADAEVNCIHSVYVQYGRALLWTV